MATPQEVQSLIYKYRATPQLFDDTQIDELEKLAEQYNITFNPQRNNTSLGKVMKQVTSGLFEGFTTIPVGEKPKNTYESIAHSLGHLIGFAPGIMSGPLRALGMGAKAINLGRTAKAFESASQGAQVLNKMSVPMIGGKYANQFQDSIFRKSGLEAISYLKKGGFARSVVDQAQHLGAASAVSSIWQGPDTWIDAYMGGAIAGGAFATLGEMKLVGKQLASTDPKFYRKGEQSLKGVIGATMMGLPAYLRDEPIEAVLYETLLGGYFGYGSRPSAEKEGGNFIRDLMYGESRNSILKPEDVKGWRNLHKDAQDYVTKKSREQAYDYYYRIMQKDFGYDVSQVDARVYASAQKKYRTKEPTDTQIQDTLRELANDYYTGKTGYVVADAEVYTSDMQNINRLDPTDQVELSNINSSKKVTQLDKTKAHNTDKPVFVFHKNNASEVVEVSPHNGSVNGKKVGDKYKDRPVEYLEGEGTYGYLEKVAEHKSLKIDDFGVATVEGTLKDYSPFKYRVEGKDIVNELSKADFWNLENNLDNKQMYIFGGIKDKGILTLRRYHQDIETLSIKDLIKSLVNDPNLSTKERTDLYNRIQKSYLNSLNEYKKLFNTKSKERIFDTDSDVDLKLLHEKQYKSNILAEAQRNGLYETGSQNLDRLHRMMRKGYSKNVIDWTKREQLYHDKSMPLPDTIFGEGATLKFAIANDLVKDQNGKDIVEKYVNDKGETKNFESNTDGVIVVRQNVFDKIMEGLGLPGGVSMNKPVIVANIPNYGTIAIKSAGRRARDKSKLGEFMNNKHNSIDVLMFASSAKHRGDVNAFDLVYNTNTGKYEMGSNNKGFRTLELSAKDIRINLSTYENLSNVTKGMFMPRQLIGNLSAIKHSNAAETMWKEHYEPAINGSKEVNEKALEVLNGKDIDVKDIDVNDIGVENIIRIFREKGDSPLARKIARQMANMDKKGELESYTDFNPKEYEQYIFRNNRVLDNADFSEGARTSNKLGKKFWQDTYKKYMINRYIRPKYKYSSKAWLAPVYAHEMANIKEGTFKLDKGQGKMIVKGKDGKETTLAEAYKNNNLDLESFVLIRVPADSPSGARVLKFDGFTNDRGMSIKTHAKDDMYLGGADKDSDSVFIFQGLHKDVRNAFKKSANQFEKDGKISEAKSSKYDKDFGAEKDARFADPESKFSPSFRRVVAEGIYRGKHNLGPGLVSKQALTNIADMIYKNGGTLPFIYTDPGTPFRKPRPPEMLYLKVKNPEAIDNYGREIVNRSADAADNPNMINFLRMPELLWERAGFTITNKNGKRMNLTYGQIKRHSELGRIHRVIGEIDPRSQITEAGVPRNKTLNEYTQTLRDNVVDRKTGEEIIYSHDVNNLFNLAAKKMYETKFLEQEYNNTYEWIPTSKGIMSLINRMATNGAERDFILNEVSKIADKRIFSKALQDKHRILSENNFETIYRKGKVQHSVEQLIEMVEKDLLSVAHYNTLAKKAMNIYRSLKQQGVENAGKVVEEILLPIQTEINKMKYRNLNKRKFGSTDLTKTVDKEFDAEYMKLKEQGWFDGNKDVPSLWAVEKANGLRPGILSEYADLYMLSPFGAAPSGMKQQQKSLKYYRDVLFDRTGKYSAEEKYKANIVLYPHYGLQSTKYASQSVGDKAIKDVSNEYNSLFQIVKQGGEQAYVDTIPLFAGSKKKTEAIEPAEGYTYLLSNNKKVDNISETVINNTKKIKPKESLSQALNRQALTEQDVKELELFKRNLKDNPKLAENFNDFFTTFTLGPTRNMMPRDVTTMNINDVYNVNRYLKDYDRRYKKRGLALKPRNWYEDPRTISEHHALIEGKVFSSYELPVMTKDGLVKRKVKMFTSTQGELQETFATLRQNIDKNIARVQTENLSKYGFRQLTPDKADKMQDMIIDYVEGKDYKQNKFYKGLKNKKHVIDNKKITTEQLVEKYGEVTKKDLKDFGYEFIYATNKSGERVNFDLIDKDLKYGSYNEYLKWDKQGRFDFANYLNKAYPDAISMKGIPLENSYRFHYEMIIEKIINKKGLMGDKAKKYREQIRQGKFSSFQKYNIGERDMYFPHLNFGATKGARAEIEAWMNVEMQKVYDAAVARGLSEKQAIKEMRQYKAEADLFIENSSSTSGLGEKSAIDGMMHNTTDIKELNNIGIFSRPESTLERTGNMPGWDRSVGALDAYKERIINSVYKSVAVSKTQTLLDGFKRDNNFGKNTQQWADFLSIYVRDGFGHQSTFPQRIQDAMEKGLDPIAAKNTLYRGFSDTQAIKAYKYLQSKLGDMMPFSKRIPENPYDAAKEPKKWERAERARNEAISRVVHMLGRQEAKYNLITLLGTPKVMVGNLFGATGMSFNQSGFIPYKQAMDFKHVQNTLLKNQQGEWVLTRTDSKGNKSFVKTKKDLKKWLVEEGIIDSYIQGELQYNQKFSQAIKQRGQAGKEFMKELTDILRKNPDASPLTIGELAKKYNIDKKLLNASGFFMQVSERKARYDAFLSGVIKFRNSYGADGAQLNLSDPALIKSGLKSIEASQFLYHTAFRAPYMRTATGKVMTRFKHFVFQSVRARKEFYRQAKHYGFKEGTEPFEKFKRMFVTDMMITALGTLYAYSLFDTSTPPPYDFFTSMSDLLFGDKKERDRAFFGTLPRPIAPLQYGLPPISRVPINVLTPLINDDWDRFWDYHVHTMYPFGRLVRSVDKTIDEPYGTTFGRFSQQFAGLPVDKVINKIERQKILDARKRNIDQTLDASYNNE